MAKGRWFLTVRGPKVNGSFVSYRGKALEIVGDVTAVRVLSRRLVRQTIIEQKDYLLRQINPQYQAFYKLYDAKNDRPETRLRTTYTASALWTLLQMHEFEPDRRIAARITPIADYLLSMQVQDGKGKGAFHYSFDTVKNEKQLRFVVGSTAKTVFTLLELYRRTGEKRYLTAAQNAGPSGTYAGKLNSAIRRNIIFTGNLSGNPVATVEVTAAPGGSIISRRLVKSSGHKDWDDAVMRAVERTGSLPRDTDGRVPSPVTIDFNFRD